MGWKGPGNQINISENNGVKVVWDVDSIIYAGNCETREARLQS